MPSFTLPLIQRHPTVSMDDFVYDFTVYWGDGTSNTITSWDDPNKTHEYADIGDYNVTIEGTCECLWYQVYEGYPLPLTELVEMTDNCGLKILRLYNCDLEYIDPSFNKMELIDLERTFARCPNLTTIPAGLFDNCTLVTKLWGCFESSGITAIPSGLFDYCTAAEDFGYCFEGCPGLVEIPDGLFDNCPNVIYFHYCFAYCESLTTLPVLNNERVRYYYDMFMHCDNLIGLAQPFIDRSEAFAIAHGITLSHSMCFAYCESLTDYETIPSNWK